MESLKSIVCLNCGGEVEISEGGKEATCKYCRRTYRIGSTLKDSALIAFSQATEYWKTDRFADAKRKFSEVTKENPEFSEAWWGAFVSEYGIQFEYSRFGDMVPTCHRAHTVEVSKDKNYKKAVETADGKNKEEYISLGNEIERIRAEIIRKSEDGESYDVFICFKATEINAPGKTDDYYLGQDIYHELKREGYNVFFSAETLARIGEQDFEPYIFKALSTAKVMLVLCSDNEKIESAWVKNEWGRFLDMRGGKGLIPVCGNNGTKYSPYKLPEELRKLNAIEYDGKLFEKLKTKIEAYFPERVKARKEAEKKAREAEYEARFAREREEQAELLKKQQAELEAKRLAQEAEWQKQQERSEAERQAQEERTKQLEEQFKALMNQISASEKASKEKAAEAPKNAPLSDEKAEKEQSKKLREQLEADRQAQAELFKKQQEQLEALMKKMSEQSEKKADSPTPVTRKSAISDVGDGSASSSMLKRAFAFLSAGEFQSADECCEKALDIAPMTAEAYLGKLMAELQVKAREDLKSCKIPFDGKDNYKKALKYAGAELKNELENIRLESAYNRAKSEMQTAETEAEYKAAAKSFTAIKGYKDSEKTAEECLKKGEEARLLKAYTDAKKAKASAKTEAEYQNAAYLFDALGSYKDAEKLSLECLENAENARLEALYSAATKAMKSAKNEAEYEAAAKGFTAIKGYKDSEKLAEQCLKKAISARTVFGKKDLVIKNGVLESVKENVKGCTDEYYVDIPDSVTIIGQSAFSDCTGLKSVNIPSSVTVIRDHAFQGCTGLKGITVPESVADIYDHAFAGCTALTDITLPERTVVCIGKYAFAETGYYNNKLNWVNGVLYIGKYLIDAGGDVLGGGISGNYKVKEDTLCIASHAFQYCKELTGIVLPNSLKEIGSSAFFSCKKLDGVTLPYGIKRIRWCTFFVCKSLKSITLGKNVERIDGQAFSDTAIKEIQLPESVKYIEYQAFKDCKSLESVKIGSNEIFIEKNAFIFTPYATAGGYESFEREREKYFKLEWNSNKAKILKLLPKYKKQKRLFIPQRIVSIAAHAFEGSEVEELIISDGVERIGDHVFDECHKLSVLRIGKNVKTIGAHTILRRVQIEIDDENPNKSKLLETLEMFAGSWQGSVSETSDNKAEHRTVSDSVLENGECEKIKFSAGITEIKSGQFEGSRIKSIDIPEGVTKIGERAFYGCTGLTSITIPDSVTSIGDEAFRGCTGLMSVTIGNSVTSIGYDAFYGCTGLTSVTIPNSVISIGEGSFDGCTKLKSITLPFVGKSANATGDDSYFGYIFRNIPSSLKTVIITGGNIKYGAFRNCTGLTSVTLPKSLKNIGDEAFYGCSGLTGVTIPGSVTSIGDRVFCKCTSLTSVKISKGVTVIGEYMFGVCTSLTSVDIPNSVTSIKRAAFSCCTSLTSIDIADSVRDIFELAFNRCENLTSVTLETGVRAIGYDAFADCPKLETINYRGTKKQWQDVELAKGWDGNKLFHKKINFNYTGN